MATIAAADPRRPDRVRVLVLPTEHSGTIPPETVRAFEGRLLTALQQAKKFEFVVLSDLNTMFEAQRVQELAGCETQACLGHVGSAAGATQILSSRMVAEGDQLSLFAVHLDTNTGTAIKRGEFTSLRLDDLTGQLAQEVSAWFQNKSVVARREATLLVAAVEDDAHSLIAEMLADSMSGELAAIGSFKVRRKAGADETVSSGATDITHRAQIKVTAHTIERKRHHVHRYLDGNLVATMRIEDLAKKIVVFTKQISVTVSERARYSTRDKVATSLVRDAVKQWMQEIKAAGIAAEMTRREPR